MLPHPLAALVFSLTSGVSAFRKLKRRAEPFVDQQCPWAHTTAVEGQLQCRDGTLCTGWSCCTSRGGRAKCPPDQPLMCNAKTCADGDHCCKESCDDSQGVRTCSDMDQCPWEQTTLMDDDLQCADGTLCGGLTEGWSCCAGHGDRARCPPNRPLMCNDKTCSGDHCCKESCDDDGGPLMCAGSGCTWERTTPSDNWLECNDGTSCNHLKESSGWGCCSDHSGRARCPPNLPIMVNQRTCGGDDFCCKGQNDVEASGGIRRCDRASSPALQAILMVGNSYTYYNGGVDGTLRTFFAALDRAWYVKALTLGGSNWDYHVDQASAGGSSHHTALTSSSSGETRWGYVVFQERSHVPALCCTTNTWYTDSEFRESGQKLQALDNLAAARGARTVLYSTWGRRDGRGTTGMENFTTMGDKVQQGYRHYASLITRNGRSPIVVPVGRAFRQVYDDIVAAGQNTHSSSSLFYRLYDPDATHPSDLGTYLAACVFYGAITGESPVGLPSALGLSEADASTMRGYAVTALSEEEEDE